MLAICRGVVIVHGQEYGRTFGPGAVVDLDAVSSVAPGRTWRDVLGAEVALFEPAPAEAVDSVTTGQAPAEE
jgi:hypothetical protein